MRQGDRGAVTTNTARDACRSGRVAAATSVLDPGHAVATVADSRLLTSCEAGV